MRPSSSGAQQPSRRLSYASVASGATPQNVPSAGRSGAAAATHPPQYSHDYRTQRPLSAYEQDLSTGTGMSSWRKPASLPAYSRSFNAAPGWGLGLGPQTANTFFVPSYLRNSRYVAKLEAEHKAKVARERQQPSASGPGSTAASLSSSANVKGGGANVHRIAPSHRGMTYDVIESNPPKEEDQLTPLPSRWSDQDKYPGLDISNNGLDVRYSGAVSKADIEAASVRADQPMSPACGIYYFEVTINSKNKDSAIAVGFSTAEASLERLPGWETHSWGYHGDDGKMFSGEHAGKSYGPTFSATDVIGCGINFNTGQAFFTRNGTELDVCFHDLKHVRPFPTVGMKKYSGASVSVNFGQRPFVFNIDEKMAREEDRVRQEIANFKTDKLVPGTDEDSLMQMLVLQYLTHDGYVETAAAFAQEVSREKQALNRVQPATASDNTAPVDTTEAVYRQKIRSAILAGNIDLAIAITEEQFPGVLSQPQHRLLLFHLKCRKWVELISQAAELRSAEQGSAKSRRLSNGYYTQASSSAVVDDFTQDMELDEAPSAELVRADENTVDESQYRQLMVQAMAYGMELQLDYRDEDDSEIEAALRRIFSLVAYDNPKDSANGELLDRKGRSQVAEELNSAILVSLGRSPDAALMTMWKQTEALLTILSEKGGPAAFVNLRKMLNMDVDESIKAR
ncbi:hypothetical protein DV738_g1995, partial [Chaetothyriales sp. CBS 135597]